MRGAFWKYPEGPRRVHNVPKRPTCDISLVINPDDWARNTVGLRVDLTNGHPRSVFNQALRPGLRLNHKHIVVKLSVHCQHVHGHTGTRTGSSSLAVSVVHAIPRPSSTQAGFHLGEGEQRHRRHAAHLLLVVRPCHQPVTASPVSAACTGRMRT
jgi:hypothetical protein